MVKNSNTVDRFLNSLKRERNIYAYSLEVEDEDKTKYLVFVPKEDLEILESEFEEELQKLGIVLSPATERKIIKLFLKDLKEEYNLQIGDEIRSLENEGFAVYLNWTNRAMVIHIYKNGSFNSKSCKKTLYWETENGVWIVGLKNCQEVKIFINKVSEFLENHFGVNYSVNYHKACGAYEECKKV
ncbi:MAG: hypothetical protein DSY42_05885 [Aquifex sp.]|nr:MAG: hypothetical protein DSY42_05885 [Aquifex sp.]